MDSEKTENFFNTLEKVSFSTTNLIVKGKLGLVYKGTLESYNSDIFEDKEHIFNSEILDFKFDQESDTLEIIVDY